MSPVKSKAQAAYLGIHNPEVLRKWKKEGKKTSPKGLPQYSSARDATDAMHKKMYGKSGSKKSKK